MTDRRGNVLRRKLEFVLILKRVRRDKAKFIAMLQRNVESAGPCVLWTAAKRPTGYGLVSFWHDGACTKIDAQRLFLILALGRPIKPHHEAGHTEGCHNRHCVRHLEEQHWRDNLKQRDRRQDARQAGGQPGPDVPF